MKPVEPIQTIELFPPLNRELIIILKTFSTSDWSRPTVCGEWTVKDVTAHLLGGNLGRLQELPASAGAGRGSTMSYADLVDFINRRNAEWVSAARLISTGLLVEFLELTNRHIYEYFRSLEPDEPAVFGVAWAGQDQSPNWFDIAREYTERWLHQQHIREAVGAPLLTSRFWLYPVLDTFLRGLPFTFLPVDYEEGFSISIRVTGEAGGEWSLRREAGLWRLYAGADPGAKSRLRLDQDIAWRLFTKSLDGNSVQKSVRMEGDLAVCARVLDLVSIMA